MSRFKPGRADRKAAARKAMRDALAAEGCRCPFTTGHIGHRQQGVQNHFVVDHRPGCPLLDQPVSYTLVGFPIDGCGRTK